VVYFNLQEEKTTYGIYTPSQMFITSSFMLYHSIWSYLSYSIWLELVRTGPLFPYANSILVFPAPFPLAKVFIDIFTVLPMELPGFAALVQILKQLAPVWVSESLACTH
jgi:hypothetical protein